MMAHESVMTEADTCREFVTPRRVEAGWNHAPHAIVEQRNFADGRIIVAGGKVRRGKQKRADYLLFYQRDFPLAVVEAKETGLPAENGVQQARAYAEILGLEFACATNGHRSGKKYSKTAPLQFDEFAPVLAWRGCREENAQAWRVSAADIVESGYNLDRKNPNAKAGLEHADPAERVASMRGHEAEVMRRLGEIEALVNEAQV